MPVLMVEADRSTMSPARVAAKFAGYRVLFRAKSRGNDPALAEESAAERMTYWWRRAYPGSPREGYPPVVLVLAGASATTLNNPAGQVGDLAADFWRGRRRAEEYSTDSWLDYSDSIPIPVTSLDKLAELGPMGEVWWHYGRGGLLSLTDALSGSTGAGRSVASASIKRPATPISSRAAPGGILARPAGADAPCDNDDTPPTNGWHSVCALVLRPPGRSVRRGRRAPRLAPSGCMGSRGSVSLLSTQPAYVHYIIDCQSESVQNRRLARSLQLTAYEIYVSHVLESALHY
ncbi:hypothetical protein [Kitasatospora sp. NPDC088783]|uniref:hypothetical protein n=1 Tax=Kitasatospora sp. NPDC088783 TaxID=3364077 RepID=UPI0038272E29